MPRAAELDAWVKWKLEARDFETLLDQATSTDVGRRAISTPEHWYPLLYVLGAAAPVDTLKWIWQGFEHGSLSMRSLLFRG